jgi:hypothetical protein
MNVPARRPNGQLLAGTGSLNPAGRPANLVAALRAQYSHRLPELFNVLFLLTKSESENMRLMAARELLDRLVGRSVVAIDAVHAKVDIGELYLRALKKANGVNGPGESANNDAEPLEPDHAH